MKNVSAQTGNQTCRDLNATALQTCCEDNRIDANSDYCSSYWTSDDED